MGMQLDLDALRKCQKRFQKQNNCARPPMDADAANRVLIMAHDDHLLRRALSSYWADLANDPASVFWRFLADYSQSGDDFDWAELGDVRGEIPIMDGQLWGQIDDSKKLPIVHLYGENLGQGFGAKFRYNPKSDKLSRIG